ncbi:hypothetical protein QQF64_013938 [Cirrhinus molitorella]|uniref:Uncharacterized protein n=1 Tax=Cirrhinus molitorella TaxID=172907 RepID=A0ABR3LSJ1_9TELE
MLMHVVSHLPLVFRHATQAQGDRYCCFTPGQVPTMGPQQAVYLVHPDEYSVVTRELRSHTCTRSSDANIKGWIEVIGSMCHSITDRNERLSNPLIFPLSHRYTSVQLIDPIDSRPPPVRCRLQKPVRKLIPILFAACRYFSHP